MTAKGTSQRMDMSRTKWSHLIFVAISDDVLRPGLLNSTIVSCRLIDQLEKGAEEGGGPGGLRHVALM